MAITTHHDQRSRIVCNIGQDGVGDVDVGRPNGFDLVLEVVAREVLTISTPRTPLWSPVVFSFSTINSSTFLALTSNGKHR